MRASQIKLFSAALGGTFILLTVAAGAHINFAQEVGKGAHAEPITREAKPVGRVVKLEVAPHVIKFKHAGDQIPLAVFATVTDGTRRIINHSDQITYTGGSADIFTVSKDGVVTCAKNPYAVYASIIVEYENAKGVVYVSTADVPGARKAPVTPIPPSTKPPRPAHPKQTTAPGQKPK